MYVVSCFFLYIDILTDISFKFQVYVLHTVNAAEKKQNSYCSSAGHLNCVQFYNWFQFYDVP